MLADISSLSSEWLRNAVIAVAATAATSYYIMELFRKRDAITNTTITPDPLRVEAVPPAADVQQIRDKFEEHGNRLLKHDQEITSLWNTMRGEDKEIRAQMAAEFKSISLALGRIEGALGEHKQR